MDSADNHRPLPNLYDKGRLKTSTTIVVEADDPAAEDDIIHWKKELGSIPWIIEKVGVILIPFEKISNVFLNHLGGSGKPAEGLPCSYWQ